MACAAVTASTATRGAVAGEPVESGALGAAAVVGAGAVGEVGTVEVDEPLVAGALCSSCEEGVCADGGLLEGLGPGASVVPALAPAPPLGVWLDA